MFACTGAKLLALLAESALYNSLAHSFSRDNQEKGGWRQFPTPAEAGGSLAAFSYGTLIAHLVAGGCRVGRNSEVDTRHRAIDPAATARNDYSYLDAVACTVV
jgi:hypothetical protein